eukprot:Pgem_evm1s12154
MFNWIWYKVGNQSLPKFSHTQIRTYPYVNATDTTTWNNTYTVIIAIVVLIIIAIVLAFVAFHLFYKKKTSKKNHDLLWGMDPKDFVNMGGNKSYDLQTDEEYMNSKDKITEVTDNTYVYTCIAY